MAIKAFIPITNVKMSVVKTVPPKRSLKELTTIEFPGRRMANPNALQFKRRLSALTSRQRLNLLA